MTRGRLSRQAPRPVGTEADSGPGRPPPARASARAGLKTFLRVAVMHGGRPAAARILDVRSDYEPLVKELGLRALAADSSLAGRAWRLNCAPHAGPGSPAVMLEAHPADDVAAGPLAAMRVPVVNFAWLARQLRARLGLEGRLEYEVEVLDEGHPAVLAWQDGQRPDGIELEWEEPDLVVPGGCEEGEVPYRRRVLRYADSWLTAVFRAAPLAEFLDAAAGASLERSWIGCGRTYVSPASCAVVIEELVPLPAATAGPSHAQILAPDVARAYRATEGRRVAFLHLHPRELAGVAMSPAASPQDHDVFWNFDRAAEGRPCAYPIAMFGVDPRDPGPDVAAHGYGLGVLTPIRLEVECHDQLRAV